MIILANKQFKAKDLQNDNHTYTVIAENEIAILGYDTTVNNKFTFAMFPKNAMGEIITDVDGISFGLYSNDVSQLNIGTTFSLEEIVNMNEKIDELSEDIDFEQE